MLLIRSNTITFPSAINKLVQSATNADMTGMGGDIQRSYADTEHGRVHYWEIGEGPALILFHQSGQTSSEYLAIGPLLADDYRVIAIDLPNHGQSDTSDHELTMDEYADSVIDVMNNIAFLILVIKGIEESIAFLLI